MKKRRGILLGLWVLSLVGISFYGGTLSYGFFFGVTLIPFLSLLYLFCVYARFKIYQETSMRNIVCGQPQPYFFTLQNDDFFVYTSVSVRMHSSFSYVEDSFENEEYELFPGASSTFETKVVCKYRGEYEIGVKEVVIKDLFGLFQWTYAVSGQIKALVAPKVVRVGDLASIADLPILLQREAYGSTEPDVVVRDYMQGDSLKQMHWKASARAGKLLVRQSAGNESRGISLFCDTRRYSDEMREYLPLENKLLEVFLAVGSFFTEKGRSYTAYYGQQGTVCREVGDRRAFDEFYRCVSTIRFERSERLEAVAEDVFRQGGLGGMAFFVVHEPAPALLDLTERLAARGVVVVLYVVTDEDASRYGKLGNGRRRVMTLPVEGDLEGRL